MFKLQITKIENDIATIEVLKGNTVVFTKEYKVDLDFKLDEIKKQLRQEAELREVKKQEEDRVKDKVEDLKDKVGKLINLN